MKRYTVQSRAVVTPGKTGHKMEVHEVIDTATGKCVFDTGFYAQALARCDAYNLNDNAARMQTGRKMQ